MEETGNGGIWEWFTSAPCVDRAELCLLVTDESFF